MNKNASTSIEEELRRRTQEKSKYKQVKEIRIVKINKKYRKDKIVEGPKSKS
jgi:hypothetical protein